MGRVGREPAHPPEASDRAHRLRTAWPAVESPAARRLLIAAAEAFAERGFHATTTRDIAGRAGMSAGGLYVHFGSKEELLFQISFVGHQQALAVVVEAGAGLGPDADPTACLRAVVRDFATWHALHHTTARVIQYEIEALTVPHLAAVAEVRRQIDQVVRGVIECGVASGDFDAPDVAGAALAILSLSIDVARWFNESTRREPDAIGALYADLAVRMLRSRQPDESRDELATELPDELPDEPPDQDATAQVSTTQTFAAQTSSAQGSTNRKAPQ